MILLTLREKCTNRDQALLNIQPNMRVVTGNQFSYVQAIKLLINWPSLYIDRYCLGTIQCYRSAVIRLVGWISWPFSSHSDMIPPETSDTWVRSLGKDLVIWVVVTCLFEDPGLKFNALFVNLCGNPMQINDQLTTMLASIVCRDLRWRRWLTAR